MFSFPVIFAKLKEVKGGFMPYQHDDHVFTKYGVITGVLGYLALAFIIASPFLLS